MGKKITQQENKYNIKAEMFDTSIFLRAFHLNTGDHLSRAARVILLDISTTNISEVFLRAGHCCDSGDTKPGTQLGQTVLKGIV